MRRDIDVRANGRVGVGRRRVGGVHKLEGESTRRLDRSLRPAEDWWHVGQQLVHRHVRIHQWLPLPLAGLALAAAEPSATLAAAEPSATCWTAAPAGSAHAVTTAATMLCTDGEYSVPPRCRPPPLGWFQLALWTFVWSSNLPHNKRVHADFGR